MFYEKKKIVFFIIYDLVEVIVLLDCLLVMSECFGIIVEEIEVNLLFCDNLLECCKLFEIGFLQGCLMELFKVGKEIVEFY